MKKIVLLLVLLSLYSCEKENESPLIENSEIKISKITYGFYNGNRVYDVTYNGNNIVELTSNIDKLIFDYDNFGNLITKELYLIGNPQIQNKSEYSFNQNNELIIEKNYSFYNNSLNYNGKYEFIYSENKLIEIKNYDDNDILENNLTLLWVDDNPIQLNVYSGNGDLECSNNINYDLNIENKFNNTFKKFSEQNYMDTDLNIYFFRTKNIITSISRECPNTETKIIEYTYAANGYIKEMYYNGDFIWSFEYE